jgi:hypothetical protein
MQITKKQLGKINALLREMYEVPEEQRYLKTEKDAQETLCFFTETSHKIANIIFYGD